MFYKTSDTPKNCALAIKCYENGLPPASIATEPAHRRGEVCDLKDLGKLGIAEHFKEQPDSLVGTVIQPRMFAIQCNKVDGRPPDLMNCPDVYYSVTTEFEAIYIYFTEEDVKVDRALAALKEMDEIEQVYIEGQIVKLPDHVEVYVNGFTDHAKPLSQTDLDVFAGIDPPEADAVTVSPDGPLRPCGGAANPFEKYSLLGLAAELLTRAVANVPLFGEVASQGEATVWYGKHGTGKTLIFLALLIEAIMRGRIDPAKVFYLNLDDSSSGLAQKVSLLEEHGVHVLAPGERGFRANMFGTMLISLVESGDASGTVIIVDTLKKLVSLMDKTKSSAFADIIRQFVMAGGTFLGLAHTNKYSNADGVAIYAGTSDILDDFDRGYRLEVIADDGECIVKFTALKSRGSAAQEVAYAYDSIPDTPYLERLMSVHEVPSEQCTAAQIAYQERSDADMIAVIKTCIIDGFNTKMVLAAETATKAGTSRRSALAVIEAYTGDDIDKHHWNYVVRDRGAKVFRLIGRG